MSVWRTNLARSLTVVLTCIIVLKVCTDSNHFKNPSSSSTILTKSARKEDARMADFISKNCTGTPQERRALAQLGDAAQAADWERMTRCVIERRNTLQFHFGLHVSKSGGTSVCDLFKQEKCWTDDHKHGWKRDNCWMKENNIDLSPSWFRHDFKYKADFNRPSLMAEKNLRDDVSCQELVQYLKSTKIGVAMSENYLPNHGNLCSQDFSNLFMMREPMERLYSHYNNIFKIRCNVTGTYQSNSMCQRITMPWEEQPPQNASNPTRIYYLKEDAVTEVIDMISDNYYTRTLNNRDVFFAPFGLATNTTGQKALNVALETLRSFDWVLLLRSNEGNKDIFKHGLGLNSTLGHSRPKSPIFQTTLTSKGQQYLESVNRLDQELWKEAQELHALDVKSIEYMQKYGNGMLGGANSSSSQDCCGAICPNIN